MARARQSKGESAITKLDGARRQIDAAIRMTLLDEDALAIHTVIAAANQVLRDLEKNRGLPGFTELLTAGFFGFAQRLAINPNAVMPPWASRSTELREMLESTALQIKSGQLQSYKDLEFDSSTYWREAKKPANFLKHADRDAEQSLDVEDLNNYQFLFAAVNSYERLLGHYTPEMRIYMTYLLVLSPKVGCPGWDDETSRAFLALTPARRRQRCRALLKQLKAAG